MQYFKKGEIVGYFSPIEDNVLEKGLAGAVFGHFSREPEDPTPGSSSVPLSEEDRKFETLSKVHKKTLNRLQEQMLEYDFVICYKKGIDNTAADALSRNVITRPLTNLLLPCLMILGILFLPRIMMILFKMSRHLSRRVRYLVVK